VDEHKAMSVDPIQGHREFPF